MKIHSNIPKLQQGGAALPFVSWTPVPDTPYSAAAASTTATKEKKEALKVEDVIPKEMIEALKQKGLPSDMSVFTESIMSLFNDPIYKITGQLNPSTLSTRYLSIINKINNIAFNKELYDKSIDRLQQNGGLYDVAVSNTGRMVVQDLETGQIKQVSPDEYYEKLGSYKAISNGDLAHIRAYNPSMAFSSDVFSVLNNGMGQETLQKYINDAISNLGSTSSNIEGYTRVQKDRIQNGLSELVNNDTVAAAIVQDGVYKLTHEQQSDVEQAQEALKYLYTSLPMAAKNYLRAKAAEQGIDPDEAAEKILVPFISSKFNSSRTIKFDYDKQASDASGSGGSDKNTIKIDQQDQIYEGVRSSGSSQDIILNTGSNYEFKLPGIHINALKTLNQEEITGSERMDKVLQNSTLSAGNQGNMWFGGKKLSPKDTNKLIYDPEAGLNAAYVPIKDDGSPDFDALETITKVQEDIKRTPGMSEQEKRQKFKDKDIEQYYDLYKDEKSLYNSNKVKLFYMVNAVGISDDFDNPYVVDQSDDYDSYFDYMNRIINSDAKKGSEVDLNGTWFLSIGNFGRDNIYKGTFYIEAPNAMEAKATTGSIYVPKSDSYASNFIGRREIKTSGIGNE